jgi:hypothetical protein
MAHRSEIVSGAGFVAEFITALFFEVRRKGGNDAKIYEALKTGSPVIPQIADIITGWPLNSKDVAIEVQSFPKDSLFGTAAPVKIRMYRDFKRRVLPFIADPVPHLVGRLSATDLVVPSYDSQILETLKANAVFAPNGFAAVASSLLTSQMSDESGMLLMNGIGNLFYLCVADTIVPVIIASDYGVGQWYISAVDFNNDEWQPGLRVFSRG